MIGAKTLLSSNLKKIREERGLTQAQLAELVSLSPKMIQKLEYSTSSASAETLDRLAEALDVDVAQLFFTDSLSQTLLGRKTLNEKFSGNSNSSKAFTEFAQSFERKAEEIFRAKTDAFIERITHAEAKELVELRAKNRYQAQKILKLEDDLKTYYYQAKLAEQLIRVLEMPPDEQKKYLASIPGPANKSPRRVKKASSS